MLMQDSVSCPHPQVRVGKPHLFRKTGAAGSDSSLPTQSLHDSEEQTTNDQKRSNCIEQIYANTTVCW